MGRNRNPLARPSRIGRSVTQRVIPSNRISDENSFVHMISNRNMVNNAPVPAPDIEMGAINSAIENGDQDPNLV